MDLFNSSSADISDCKMYRYKLWRVWDKALPICNYIMLNPSTANETNDDHTITRCINRARALGYGGILVSNLFAFRTSYPKLLKSGTEPIGINNDECILECAISSSITICAWGNDGNYLNRDQEVRALLKQNKIKTYHLGLSKNGKPLHPSSRGKVQCIDYKTKPLIWD